jgi:hypothetical protein
VFPGADVEIIVSTLDRIRQTAEVSGPVSSVVA